MIVDSSALLAILFGAPDGGVLLSALVDAEHPRMSVANWLEVAMLIEEKGGRLASLRFDEFFRTAARTAWRHFGRHKHSARLNFGDCFAYALAKSRGEELLYAGGDFSRTDIEPALKDH
jgi:ribonuclease VapC